jgi:hypothetical protein
MDEEDQHSESADWRTVSMKSVYQVLAEHQEHGYRSEKIKICRSPGQNARPFKTEVKPGTARPQRTEYVSDKAIATSEC